MIEIDEGLFICVSHVVAVKSVDDGKCAIFMVGQSAADGGFLVERDALEVAEEITDELEDGEGSE